jgi:sugar phosphate isomerase/epimerase
MPGKLPVALQMYTVRDDAQADLAATLRRVKEIGYGAVEIAGYAGTTAAEYQRLLSDNGLQAISAHVGFDLVTKQIAQVIDEAALLGLTRVVVPWIGSPYTDSMDGFLRLGDALGKAAAALGESGIALGYHNHAFEFEQSVDGVFAFDAIFDAAPAIFVEMDTFWVKKGGQDPAAYLRRYTGRVPLIHLKDMDADGNFAPVGAGTIDYTGSLLPAAYDAGVEAVIVEQDSCQAPLTPLESARISFENLRAWGVA